jgi:hypothetical protein
MILTFEEILKQKKVVVLSILGPHAGEQPDEFMERKIKDVSKVGHTFWYARSYKCKPHIAQQFGNIDPELYVLFLGSERNIIAGEPTKSCEAARACNADRNNPAKWETLHKHLSPVTGRMDTGAHGLKLDQLQLVKGVVIADMLDFAEPIEGEYRPVKTGQGHSTVPAYIKSMHKHPGAKPKRRRVYAIGRLTAPFGVWFRG